MYEAVRKFGKAGKAKHFIENGQLFLESPAVPDGIILYFKQKLEGDVTVECKIDPSNVDPGTLGCVGFTDGISDPEPSPDFWVHWLSHFNFAPTVSTPFVDDHPGQNGFPKAGDQFNFQAGPHVWKFKDLFFCISVLQKNIKLLKGEK